MAQESEEDKKLPGLSNEQKQILKAVSDGWCVSVNACAGSGKTTTLLNCIKHEKRGSRFLLLMYNKQLQNETVQRAKNMGIEDLHVYTFHAFAGKVVGRVAFDDRSLVEVVNIWENAKPHELRYIPKFDVLIIDEVQDMNPLMHRIVCATLRFASPLFNVGDTHAAEPNDPDLQLIL
eukprot:2153226-Pleurochrysis_carterae.AAC.1